MINTDTTQHPLARWSAALGWTALVLVLLLQSSSQPVIGPAAPPGDPPLEREILLTAGHVVAFAVLTALWWWALSLHTGPQRSLVLAVMVALLISVCTELAQAAVPDRAASWFDISVNVLVTLVTAWRIQTRSAR
ncbi:MAG TPA: VanZ family protein [Spirillospora sp.]|nr:VanZ family protein [Spirillospora sp.]